MTNEFYKNDIAHFKVNGEPACYMDVIVSEVKFAYGNVRYVVSPVRGKGKMTVEKLYKIKKGSNRAFPQANDK